MRKTKKAFTIVELVIVIAVIAIIASVLIPTFTSVINSANISSALQETRSKLSEYLASYQNQIGLTCFYHGNPKKGYYVFLYAAGALNHIGDISATVSKRLDETYVGADSEWYSFKPKQGFEAVSLRYADSESACGRAYYSGFYIDISTMEIESTVIDGECSFGVPESNNVQRISGSIAVSDYMMLDGRSITTVPHTIKNIIYMIPDGAGWGTYDLADEVKRTALAQGKDRIGNALTTLTTDTISGMSVTGLYLDEFLIGSADTLLAFPNGTSYVTDSAAAGTAIACGLKTSYLRVAVNKDMIPVPSIFELCKIQGKATGVVTTKSWIDATPTAFLCHANKRASQNNVYQAECSLQMLSSGVDLLLAYGTSSGVHVSSTTDLHTYDASDFGYTVVDNLAQLNSAVAGGATRLWSNFTEGNDNGSHSNYDYSANHISYDVHGTAGQLSLLDMTKVALNVLYKNIGDEDGFFLMVEGGAIDNAAESAYATEAVGDYLAFDETFAYCVNWAKGRDDTLVVAIPDHDSGGLTIGKDVAVAGGTDAYDTDHNGRLNENECLSYVVNTIISGVSIGSNSSPYIYTGHSGHSEQEVPVWMYAPDWCRNAMLYALNIPLDVTPDKVRTGRFYDGTTVEAEYNILNSDISPAVIKACGLMGFAEAGARLLVNADGYIASMNTADRTINLTNGEVIYYNTNKWAESAGSGTRLFDFGCSCFIFDDTISLAKGHLYLPREFFISRGYLSE